MQTDDGLSATPHAFWQVLWLAPERLWHQTVIRQYWLPFSSGYRIAKLQPIQFPIFPTDEKSSQHLLRLKVAGTATESLRLQFII